MHFCKGIAYNGLRYINGRSRLARRKRENIRGSVNYGSLVTDIALWIDPKAIAEPEEDLFFPQSDR